MPRFVVGLPNNSASLPRKPLRAVSISLRTCKVRGELRQDGVFIRRYGIRLFRQFTCQLRGLDVVADKRIEKFR